MLFKRNLLRKLMGMSIFQTAIILFYVGGGIRRGTTIPVIEHSSDPSLYANPLPHVLMLTAIVVSVASTGVGLALLMSIYRSYGTIDEPTALERVHQES